MIRKYIVRSWQLFCSNWNDILPNPSAIYWYDWYNHWRMIAVGLDAMSWSQVKLYYTRQGLRTHGNGKFGVGTQGLQRRRLSPNYFEGNFHKNLENPRKYLHKPYIARNDSPRWTFLLLPVWVNFISFCRRDAYRLHAEWVWKTLTDISSKSGRIWTKLGRRMGNGEKSDAIKFRPRSL